jgi:hypothetical protein
LRKQTETEGGNSDGKRAVLAMKNIENERHTTTLIEISIGN